MHVVKLSGEDLHVLTTSHKHVMETEEMKQSK